MLFSIYLAIGTWMRRKGFVTVYGSTWEASNSPKDLPARPPMLSRMLYRYGLCVTDRSAATLVMHNFLGACTNLSSCVGQKNRPID
jgi:hypothetical protein